MADLSPIQHVVPAPAVAHDPHRIHRAGDRPERDPKRHAPKEDALELHEEEVEEETSSLNPAATFTVLDSESHIDIAI